MRRKITDRKINILKLIVQEYVQSGDVVGSKSLLKKHELGVSPATIRNDMATLEKMGLIFQPYNSAGRLPTTQGIRVFVDYLMEALPQHFLEVENELVQKLEKSRVQDALYDLVSRLTRVTKEITFGCIASEGKSYYLGLSNFLEKNAPALGDETYNIIHVLENKYRFLDLLRDLNISEKISVFIGKENILPDLESCTLIAKKIELEGKIAIVGILSSLRCDYAFNIAALKHLAPGK